MATIKLNTQNPEELLKGREPIDSGVYLCEVEGPMKIENAQKSNNKIVPIILRVLNNGEFKGRKIFDRLIIGATPEIQDKVEWKIVQFAVATECYTAEELQTEDIELDSFIGAQVSVEVEKVNSEYTDPVTGDFKSTVKNEVKRYIINS